MSLGSFTFWYLVLFVLVIWMALRVGRSSSSMGIMTFFFWPIAVVPLFTNWGDRDSDIRIPFVLTALASLMMLYNTNKAVDQLAMNMDSDDIAYIRESDPETAAMIEQRQAALGLNVEFEDEISARSGRIVASSITVTRVPDSHTRRDGAANNDMQFAPAPAQIRDVPLNELHFRRGMVRLAPAFSSLQIPEHFRFISAQQLGRLAASRGVEVNPQTLGWMVHERVDLRSRDFWFVDIQFHESGHLEAPANSSSLAQWDPSDSQLRWDAGLSAATWAHGDSETSQSPYQRAVAKLLRHGVLLFSVGALSAEQGELGLRATRMLLARTHADAGWDHAQFIGKKSEQSLDSWVRSRAGDMATNREVEVVESAVQSG